MRKTVALLFLAALAAVPAFGQYPVFDIASLQQSVTNYSALTEQISKQATQISNQVQQIRQADTELQRMGDMAGVRSLVGFSAFRADLNVPTKITAWVDGLGQVDGRGIFGDTRGGLFPGINAQFSDFDGATIDRDPEIFK